MPLVPLASPPTPPNGNMARAVFVWVPNHNGGSDDPIGNAVAAQALVTACGANGANAVFLDVWQYLGGTNYTAARVALVRTLVEGLRKSGVKVYALAGNTDWAINHQWVMVNVVDRLAWYLAGCTSPAQRFDGLVLDVEYWTVGGQASQVHAPGLCDLVAAIKRRDATLEVGAFVAFYLKDNAGTQPAIAYKGQTAQDGAFLVDACDFLVVGAYRNHAADGGTEAGPGQNTLFQPWYDYAAQVGNNTPLYCGSEVGAASPAYVTYQGATKSAMEAQHAATSALFKVAGNCAFAGHAIDPYSAYATMAP